ncbi:uncharacterized protein LOC127254585 [Andrographis paniculata]|uniref:uncharacterized protein LOC127254585 n=1 Tax=Andrographis paniculata TaxID=175694 RepID=UPI0021E78BA4|nr:uncharacterized protein LOC127254585 [Andrographis paniculata]
MAVEDPNLMASLYVGDLRADVTENDLVEAFERVGPLLSVRICRDKISRKSLCYGYVNFWLPCYASAALQRLNHTRLKGKPMRIMWCERNPMARKNNNANLFVKNLDLSITGARLQEIFSKYGTILSCKVAEERGISKGFGFVQFDSEDSAIAALHALHDSVLEGKKLYVSKFLTRTERKKDLEHIFKNLYVKNLDEDIAEENLKEKFSEHGKILSAVIIKDENGKSRGYGFVNFESHEGAKKAMEVLNGGLLGSKTLSVAWAHKRGERMQNLRQLHGYKCDDQSKQLKASNLHVKNLSPYVDERKLEEHFSCFGKIVSAKVIRNVDGVSKNFGFVRFSCPEEAKQALTSLTGTDFEGRTIHLTFAHRQERQTGEMLKLCSKLPVQPHCISTCQPLDCCQLPFCSPLTPFIQLNQMNPMFYQNFAGHLSSCNSFQGQDFPRIFNTFPFCNAALDQCRQYHIKPSSDRSLNKYTGDVKEYCKGYGAMRASLTIPSPKVCKTGQSSNKWHPLVQNLQPGLAASGHELQLEMEKAKCEAWRIMNPSRSSVNAN